jgi:hypothetical protein
MAAVLHMYGTHPFEYATTLDVALKKNTTQTLKGGQNFCK